MSIRYLASFLVLLTCLPSVAGAQIARQITPFTADLEFSNSSAPDSSINLKGKIYVGKDAMRVELATPQGPSINITNFIERTVYALAPAQHTYIEHPMELSRRRRPPGWADLKPLADPNDPCAGEQRVTCKKIGVEKIANRLCDRWELSERGGVVSEMWIDQKLRFPAKIMRQRATWLLSNIREGESSPSLFQVPSDYHKPGTPNAPPPSSPPQ